jgi:hypothetical protein
MPPNRYCQIIHDSGCYQLVPLVGIYVRSIADKIKKSKFRKYRLRKNGPITFCHLFLLRSSDGIGVAFESFFGSVPFAGTNFATKQAIVVLWIVGQELMSIPDKKLATSRTDHWDFSPFFLTFFATKS